MENLTNQETKEEILEIAIELISLMNKKPIPGTTTYYEELPIRVKFQEREETVLSVELHNSQRTPNFKTVFNARFFNINKQWKIQCCHYGLWVKKIKDKIADCKDTQFNHFDDTEYY